LAVVDLNQDLWRSALEVWHEAGQRWLGLAGSSSGTGPASTAADKRFAAPEWHTNPVYRTLQQIYLLASDWLLQQRRRSVLPGPRDLLVETFARMNRHYLVCYPFEGRLAHQTLGMLLTRRLERAKLRPNGFVANDYGIAVWGNGDISQRVGEVPGFLDDLFSEDMLGDDLEDWLAEAALMKRSFRQCAIIAGLIERRFPGQEKTKRQVTMSTDLVYDVLRKYQPDHVLLRAARADAATGLLDVRRLGVMLARIRGRIIHKALERVSPMSVSVMLEIGRERVHGEGADEILAEAEAELIEEALA